MNPPIPRYVSAGIIVIAVLAALYLVGFVTPGVSKKGVGMIGQPAPALSGPTVDGTSFDLAAAKGKVVLVNFWATWCGPCQMEIPDLIKLQTKYASRGFTVVGVSYDEKLETAAAFAHEKKMTYPILQGTDAMRKPWGNIEALPTSYLLDRDGTIVWEIHGFGPNVDFAGEVEKVL